MGAVLLPNTVVHSKAASIENVVGRGETEPVSHASAGGVTGGRKVSRSDARTADLHPDLIERLMSTS